MNRYEKFPTALKDLAIEIIIFLKIAVPVNKPPFLLFSKLKNLTAILFIHLHFYIQWFFINVAAMLFRLEILFRL